MLENIYEGLNALKCKGRSNQKIKKTKCINFRILFLGGPSPPVNWSATHSKVYFFKVYFSKVYLSKMYQCEVYSTCVSSKLCEFILVLPLHFNIRFVLQFSVTLAACLLFIIGAFKSAAITPPVKIKILFVSSFYIMLILFSSLSSFQLGVDLDTRDDYIRF